MYFIPKHQPNFCFGYLDGKVGVIINPNKLSLPMPDIFVMTRIILFTHIQGFLITSSRKHPIRSTSLKYTFKISDVILNSTETRRTRLLK